MNASTNLLEQQLSQSRKSEKLLKETILKMARSALKNLPREDLIELLIKRKVIMKDWTQKGNKYILKENA